MNNSNKLHKILSFFKYRHNYCHLPHSSGKLSFLQHPFSSLCIYIFIKTPPSLINYIPTLNSHGSLPFSPSQQPPQLSLSPLYFLSLYFPYPFSPSFIISFHFTFKNDWKYSIHLSFISPDHKTMNYFFFDPPSDSPNTFQLSLSALFLLFLLHSYICTFHSCSSCPFP